MQNQGFGAGTLRPPYFSANACQTAKINEKLNTNSYAELRKQIPNTEICVENKKHENFSIAQEF